MLSVLGQSDSDFSLSVRTCVRLHLLEQYNQEGRRAESGDKQQKQSLLVSYPLFS